MFLVFREYKRARLAYIRDELVLSTVILFDRVRNGRLGNERFQKNRETEDSYSHR